MHRPAKALALLLLCRCAALLIGSHRCRRICARQVHALAPLCLIVANLGCLQLNQLANQLLN